MGVLIPWRRRSLAGAVAGILVGLLGLGGPQALADDKPTGNVYTLTNAGDGNQLAVFHRNAQGGLMPLGMVPTGGLGTGGGLGSQGALALVPSTRTIYAVNAGSNSVTVFRLKSDGPRVIQVIGSGGYQPISLAVGSGVLYVLNAGGSVGGVDQITGFQIDGSGQLQLLRNSTRPLSVVDASPAQVGFNEDGDTLVVTEKGTNVIDTYRVGRNGYATGLMSQPSAGMTPYGFAFNEAGYLIVSEAFGGADGASAVSSYRLNSDTGRITVVSPSVPTTQTAACWIAVTRNGRFAYASNTGSGTVTGYSVASRTGALARLQADGISGVNGGAAIDAATVGDRFLYVLTHGPEASQLVGFRIDDSGSLTSLNTAGGLSSSAGGLAAD